MADRRPPPLRRRRESRPLGERGQPGSAVRLWATTHEGEGPAGRLRALDPLTFAVLFDTEPPAWSRFTPPTVARGLVLVPSTSTDPTVFREVLVFGLRAERQ